MLTNDGRFAIASDDGRRFAARTDEGLLVGGFSGFVAGGTLYACEILPVAGHAAELVDALVAWARATSEAVGSESLVCLLAEGERPGMGEQLVALGARDISYARELRSLELALGGAPGARLDEGEELCRELEPAELATMVPQVTLYLVPHQDDELYTMGADIVARSAEGPTVVILIADGSLCFVRGLLHDGGSCPELGDRHEWDLSTEDFVAARDREFASSCAALGVPASNVHYAQTRMQDLSVDPDVVVDEIKRFCHAHPLARICAHAPRPEVSQDPTVRGDLSLAPHVDHCMVGVAVERLRKKGLLATVQYCVEFYDLDRFVRDNPDVRLARHGLDEAGRAHFQEALAAYRLWDPEAGRFAVGWHSGPDMWEGALEASTTYAYDPARPGFEDATADELRDHMAVLGEVLRHEHAATERAAAEAQAQAARAQELESALGEARGRADEVADILAHVEGSVSFRAGRALTSPLRFVRDKVRR